MGLLRSKFFIPLLLFFAVILVVIDGVLIVRMRVGSVAQIILPAKVTNGENLGLKLPEGYTIGRFATDITAARDLQFTPGGTLLVSEISAGKVVALRDTKDAGAADQKKDILTGLDTPHGLAIVGDKLLVAEQRKLSRYTWDEASQTATLDKKLLDLPPGGRHITRSVVVDQNGKVYVSLGSTCDTCIESNPWIAGVIQTDMDGNSPRVYSTGLRNAVFLAVNPKTDQVWDTEMGRDYLGDDAPPDEINILKDGGNYGWPFCYGDQVPDKSMSATAAQCATTVAPIFKVPAHSAPLGLVFIDSPQFPDSWQGDLLVPYHGSWNRTVPTGYKIVHMKVNGNKISYAEDFITDFLQGAQVVGRPVDLAFDSAGSLYISDDKANAIYKVIKK